MEPFLSQTWGNTNCLTWADEIELNATADATTKLSLFRLWGNR